MQAKNSLQKVRSQYESCAEEVDWSILNLEAQDELQDSWDQVAPQAETQEAIDDDILTDHAPLKPWKPWKIRR